jgi:hypothetical protein
LAGRKLGHGLMVGAEGVRAQATGSWYPTLSAKNAERMGHPSSVESGWRRDGVRGIPPKITPTTKTCRRGPRSHKNKNVARMGHPESWDTRGYETTALVGRRSTA